MKNKKDVTSSERIIRVAGAAAGYDSMTAIAEAAGIPDSTLRKRMKNFTTFRVGELCAIMKELPELTDEAMGRAIRLAK